MAYYYTEPKGNGEGGSGMGDYGDRIAGRDSQPVTKVTTKYFGVYIPQEDWVLSGDESCVVTCFTKLQSILKRNPRSRFKAADTEEEAYFLALESAESIWPFPSEAAELRSPETDNSLLSKPKNRRGRLSLSDLDTYAKSPTKPELMGVKRVVAEEKDNRFPSPKIQELTLMGREIAQNKTEAMIAKVKSNPRMLITDSDVPTTVQEGCRYNAVHVAAKCDNKEAIAFILNTVSSLDFMKLLYPKDHPTIIKDRIQQIVTGYLNTPDKMANETPLHYACKFLSVGAAEVLLSHPLCLIECRNLYGEIPESIIGSRADAKSKDFSEKKMMISKLLNEMFIVPIWRDPMLVLNPVVGKVASLRKLGDRIPSNFLKHFPNLEITALGHCDQDIYPWEKYNMGHGAVFQDEVRWEVKAYGGPTTYELARQLHADLRLTCGRAYVTDDSRKPTPAPILYDSRNRPIVAKDQRNQRRADAANANLSPPCTPPRSSNERSPPVSPFEYSPMVSHLKSVGSPISPGPKEIITRRIDPEKGLERVTRTSCVKLGIQWNEEWRFLNFFGDIMTKKGLDMLEDFFLKVELARKDTCGKVKTTNFTPGKNSVNGQRVDGKVAGGVSNLCFLDSPIGDGSGALSPNNSFDEFVIRLKNMKINSPGYPTPPTIIQCENYECRRTGRFCTCNAVAPSLYFVQRQQQNQMSQSSPSSSSYDGDSSEGFEVNNSGDSFYRRPVTEPINLGITRLDEPRVIVDSFMSADSESSERANKIFDSSNSALESSDEHFVSTDISPAESSEFLDCRDDPIFLNGSEPCKQDFQLFNLMKEEEENLSEINHLLVFQWFNTMKALGDREWRQGKPMTPTPSLSENRGRIGLRIRDFPTFHSTPKKLNML